MNQFDLPLDFGDVLANRQLELPLTDEVTLFNLKLNEVLSELGTTPNHHSNMLIRPSWPPRQKLPNFR